MYAVSSVELTCEVCASARAPASRIALSQSGDVRDVMATCVIIPATCKRIKEELTKPVVPPPNPSRT